MKLRIITAILLACSLTTSYGWAQQKQKPPAARIGLDPVTRNKLATTLSRARINPDTASATAQQSVVSGPAGKNCTTSIGSAPEADKPGIGNKYGSATNKDQIIVVQGPVINICK